MWHDSLFAGGLRHTFKDHACGHDGNTLQLLPNPWIILDTHWLLCMGQDFLKDQLNQTERDSQKREKYPGY
jgi:hypothetical protein